MRRSVAGGDAAHPRSPRQPVFRGDRLVGWVEVHDHDETCISPSGNCRIQSAAVRADLEPGQALPADGPRRGFLEVNGFDHLVEAGRARPDVDDVYGRGVSGSVQEVIVGVDGQRGGAHSAGQGDFVRCRSSGLDLHLPERKRVDDGDAAAGVHRGHVDPCAVMRDEGVEGEAGVDFLDQRVAFRFGLKDRHVAPRVNHGHEAEPPRHRQTHRVAWPALRMDDEDVGQAKYDALGNGDGYRRVAGRNPGTEDALPHLEQDRGTGEPASMEGNVRLSVHQFQCDTIDDWLVWYRRRRHGDPDCNLGPPLRNLNVDRLFGIRDGIQGVLVAICPDDRLRHDSHRHRKRANGGEVRSVSLVLVQDNEPHAYAEDHDWVEKYLAGDLGRIGLGTQPLSALAEARIGR